MFKSKLFYVTIALGIVVSASLSLSAPPIHALPLLQGGASISVDKTEYVIGEEVRWCYSVPRPAYVDISVFLEDGSRRQILAGNDDGRGDCLTGTAGEPVGRRRLVLTVSSGGAVIATAETYYRVVNWTTPTPTPIQELGWQVFADVEEIESRGVMSGLAVQSLETTQDLRLSIDRNSYRLGDTITFCYRLPRRGNARVMSAPTGGPSVMVIERPDDYGERCFRARIVWPRGPARVCLRIEFEGVSVEVCFDVDGVPPPPPPPVREIYSIINHHSQMCLEARGWDAAVQASCTWRDDQMWERVPLGYRYDLYQFVNRSTRQCLDARGIDIVQGDCRWAQSWWLQSFGSYSDIARVSTAMHHAARAIYTGTYYQISGANRECVDADGWNHNQGGRIISWGCASRDNDNQLWGLMR